MGLLNSGRLKKHTAEQLVPGSSASDVEVTIENLQRHNSTGIDNIPA